MTKYIDNYIKENKLKNPFQFIYDYNTKYVTFNCTYYNPISRNCEYLWENKEVKQLFICMCDNYDYICKIKNKEITKEQLNISNDTEYIMYLEVDIHYYTHDGYCSDSENEYEYEKITKYLLFKIPSFLKEENDINFNLFKNDTYKWDKYQTCKLKNNDNTKLLFEEWNEQTSRTNGHDYCSQIEEYEPKNYYLIKL